MKKSKQSSKLLLSSLSKFSTTTVRAMSARVPECTGAAKFKLTKMHFHLQTGHGTALKWHLEFGISTTSTQTPQCLVQLSNRVGTPLRTHATLATKVRLIRSFEKTSTNICMSSAAQYRRGFSSMTHATLATSKMRLCKMVFARLSSCLLHPTMWQSQNTCRGNSTATVHITHFAQESRIRQSTD